MTPHNDDDQECACRKDEALAQTMDGYLRAACEGKKVFRAYVEENASISREEFRARNDDDYVCHSRIIQGSALFVFFDDDGRSTAYVRQYEEGLPVELLRSYGRITAEYVSAYENGSAYFNAFVERNGAEELSKNPARYTHDLGDDGVLVIQIDKEGRHTAFLESSCPMVATVQ